MTERSDKYWMCDFCADKRGFKPFKECYTITSGLCGWCDDETERPLTPLRDLKSSMGRRADSVMFDGENTTSEKAGE